MRTSISVVFGFLSVLAFSQSRTISGSLSDAYGDPLPGINIIIKGSSTGTVTDFDGQYTITAPIGATLLFSGVGFATREVVVGDDLHDGTARRIKKDKRKKPQFPIELVSDTLTNQPGTGVFGNDSKTYKSIFQPEILKINKVKENGHKFIIKTLDAPTVRKGFGLQYSQVLGITRITQLPDLQSAFAQGRPAAGSFQWFGPDTEEIFSWGPRVSNLEFDGAPYPYDLNGRLVESGSGNGISAKRYENKDLFRTGFLTKHDLLYTHSLSRAGNLIIGLNYENQSSVIPNSNKRNLSGNLGFEDIRIGQEGKMTIRSLYAKSEGNLLSHGANIARIVGDALSSPVTFDNANGRSRRSALKNSDSYEHRAGQMRSYAPTVANNPFGLMATSPDKDDHSHYFSAIEYEWTHDVNTYNVWKINAKGSYDFQELNSIFGIPAGYAGSTSGVFTERQDQKEQIDFRLTPTYKIFKNAYPYWDFTFMVDYLLSSTSRTLERRDGYSFSEGATFVLNQADSTRHLNQSINRLSHQVSPSVKIVWDRNYTLNIGSTFYGSNTVNQNDFVNFFPFIGARADIYTYPFDFSPKISYSRSIQESTLIYSDWAYASTPMLSGDFRNVYESSELLFQSHLKPEIISKIEFDLDTRFDFMYGLNLEFNYSYEVIDDFIAPVANNEDFQLQNLAKVSNESIKVNVRYSKNSYWSHWNWHAGVRWTRNVPMVISLNAQEPLVPLSGFANALSVLAEDQSLGMIYGTYYERNAEGELIIGADGYPLSSGNLKPLANPNPDWIMGFDGSVKWKNLRLNALFEFLYGAEIWNGTAAYLDYLGRSSKTGSQRNVTDYIFSGVDQNDMRNTLPVDFLDPTLDISQSRWVRYGPGGVAEDYVEDASSFRFTELILSYAIPMSHRSAMREVSLALIGQNLFQITPYTGVDPESKLFGYASGRGLDLFNMPTTRAYQLKIMVKL